MFFSQNNVIFFIAVFLTKLLRKIYILLFAFTSGLFAGTLVSKYGPKVTAILGSLLVTTGYLTTSQITDPSLLFITHGIIPGKIINI